MNSSIDVKDINLTNNNMIVKNKGLLNSNACVGGASNTNYLYNRLKDCFKKATKIDIIVSFLMKSGVDLIINDLKEALDRGCNIRILCGSYLNITQPEALYRLKDKLQNRVKIHFYSEKGSFHPKAYIFHYSNDSDLFVGSSNISRGALTNSIEWNYKLSKNINTNDFTYFMSTFDDLYNNHSIEITDEVLLNYTKSWRRPKLSSGIALFDDFPENNVTNMFEPRGSQVPILYELSKTREEGFDKGLVVAATGVGKTYLSAFDSREFNRILFVAHREEIIKQAMQSFKNIRPEKSMGYFYSDIKEEDNDIIFALVQTLGKDKYLNEEFFTKDYFDYIVVDEFHHASSNNYQKILDYFTPKFLLGLTATPERLDGKDILSICDYNLVYEVILKDAINKGDLVPFRYYGIYDDTVNYDNISFINGRLNEKQLEEALMIAKRDDLVLGNYNKYISKACIGFCSSRKHASHMAKSFNEAGVKSLAVYSGAQGEYYEERSSALDKLRNGEVQVLFTVDMFNEGLDIPNIDLVLFLRPTESPTVFLQQLGRGLRKFKDKEFLTVLDFVGNYKKANLTPFLLSGKPFNRTEAKNRKPIEFEYPDNCIVDFDFKLVDFFKKIAEKGTKASEIIKEEFLNIYDKLGNVPSRIELFRNMDDEIYTNMKAKSKENIFKDYMSYLEKLDLLSEEDLKIKNSLAYDFINMIENTAMSKSYKIPVFLAFYNNGDFKTEIDDTDLYKSFKAFYKRGTNKVDMLHDKSTKDFMNWTSKEYVKLARTNPVKFLRARPESKEGMFFYIDENTKNFCIRGLDEFKNNKIFIKEIKDAIDFRMEQYYNDKEKRNYWSDINEEI